jgi:hypothetical protein
VDLLVTAKGPGSKTVPRNLLRIGPKIIGR